MATTTETEKVNPEPAETNRLSDDRRSRAVSAVSSPTPPPPAAPTTAPPTVPASTVPASTVPTSTVPAEAQPAAPAATVPPPTRSHRQSKASRQTQTPYQPYPYPHVSQSTPGYYDSLATPYDKEWLRVKFVLTILSILLCIILLAFAIVMASPGSPSVYRDYVALWAVPFTVVIIAWDFTEIITVCTCGSRITPGAAAGGVRVRRGIHPGAHVGVDLIIWLAGVFCIFIATLQMVSGEDRIQDCAEYLSRSNTSSWYYRRCSQAEYDFLLRGNYLGLLRATVAFVCLITAVHFFIFVRACIETHQYNTTRRIVVIPQQMYYGGQPQGMMPYPGANMYQMPPPQAPIVRPYGAPILNEKQAMAQLRAQRHQQHEQQQAYDSVAGFYAPPLPPRKSDVPPTAARNSVSPPPVVASSSTQQPAVASSSTQPPPPVVEASRI